MLIVALLMAAGQSVDAIDVARYKGPAQAKQADVRAPSSERARAYFGIAGGDTSEEGGVMLADVPEEGPAARAGVRPGDRLTEFAGEEIRDFQQLAALVGARKPGDRVAVTVEREDGIHEITVELGARRAAGDFSLPLWTRSTFSLAVVLFDFPDCPHNPEFTPDCFERMLFSRGRYVERGPSGEQVYGSLADYYRENSYGRLKISGTCFEWVTLEKPRSFFEGKRMGDGEASAELLPEALELVQAREGETCFDPYDGIIFIYAGKQTYERPRLLWPHRATLKVGSRKVPYYLNAEGGKHFNAIGVHVHEFGHMLGLPDQYGRRHATGVGKWCAMAVGHMGGGESRNARPFHLCVWCKERLGWVKAVPIDPAQSQWLKLDPIERDSGQAFKIILKPDGSRCYYLENRQRAGFDRELEGTGLLIWYRRSSFGAIDLVEAHGRKVPNASLVEPEEIPFPSLYNPHFTPDTLPASAGELYLTDIVEHDGTVYFKIGLRKRASSRALEEQADY